MTPADDLPPRWFALPFTAGFVVLLAACIVGVVAAVLGVFTPPVVWVGTFVLGGTAAVVAVRALPRWTSSRSTHAAAAVTVAFATAIGAWNAANHAEHVVADRDPGVYVTTARHLIEAGDLLVSGPTGPFVDAPGVSNNGVGFSPIRDDGTLEPQFPHLTAVTLALGGWVAHTALFLVTPLLAAGGLLCLYALGTTLLGARWAAVAAAVTGLTMPFTVFARDAYSEPITTVLAFGGLWLLHLAHRTRRAPLWLLAGLALGATNMARVDSYLYLAPIALAVVLAVRLAPAADRRGIRDGALWCGLGVLIASAIGLWDTATLTGGYYDEALGGRLPYMVGAAIVAGAVTWVAAPRLWVRDGPAPGATRLLQRGGIVVAIVAAGFFAWCWWLRPDAGEIPRVATEGVRILSYLPEAATLSLRWLGWYFGPLPLAVGIAGLLLAVVLLTRPTRPDPSAVATLGCVMVPLLLYVWSPNITPDHPWAMRRFAAVAMPGIALGIGVAGRALWSLRDARPDRLRRTLAAASAIAVATSAIASAAVITWPTRDVRTQVPMLDRMRRICGELQADDAVLVPIDGILSLMMSVPVGVWCQVPSAGGTPRLEAIDVAQLAVDWEEAGRRLVVLSSSATPVFNTLRQAGIVTQTVDLHPAYPLAVEPTLTSRPDEVVVDERLGKGPEGEITFYLYVLDTDRARRLLRAQR